MHRNDPIILLMLLGTSGGLSPPVLSHSGGTDINGCHSGSKPYHCHTPKSAQSSKSSGSSSLKTGSSFRKRPAILSTPYDLERLSKLSREDFKSSEGCKKFVFSELIRQSDHGSVNLRCGQVVMSIKAHY